MDTERLVRILITFNVSMLILFFRIRDAKVNRIYRRAPPNFVEVGSRDDRILDRRPSRVTTTTTTTSSGTTTTTSTLVEHSARSGLPGVAIYARGYQLFSWCINWYFLIKSIIICSLRYEALANWRYLDCYLMGRFLINFRVIEAAPYCGCYEVFAMLCWRHLLARKSTDFKFPCLEFLLGKRGHVHFWLSHNRRASFVNPDDNKYHSALLEYQTPFEAHTLGATKPYKLRPNRTRAAWEALARAAVTHYVVFVIFYVFAAILFIRMISPVTLTQMGFASNYRHCVQWVRDQQQQQQQQQQQHQGGTGANLSSYYNSFVSAAAQIGPASKLVNRDIFMPIENLVEPSHFHIVRVGLEIIEAFVTLSEFALMMNCTCFMSIIVSKDVLYYSGHINERLENLMELLRVARASRDDLSLSVKKASYYHELLKQHNKTSSRGSRQSLDVPSSSSSSSSLLAKSSDLPAGHGIQSNILTADILDVQAQIADLFVLVDQYNRYISLQSMCQLLWWLGYSALVSGWLFLPSNESPKLEWYVIHAGISICYMIMLVNMSAIKSSCHQMYKSITVLMALDESYETSKSVWLTLMKFYAPKPIYCFTLLGSIELTHMSGLNLLAWLLGALVIISSFFQVRTIK